MRVLIVAKNAVHMRNFESTVRLLCERGHEVHIALQKAHKGGRVQNELLVRLSGEHPSLTFDTAPRGPRDGAERMAQDLRIAGDYMRFFHRSYDDAVTLRRRARDTAPGWARDLSDRWPWRTRAGRALMRSVLTALERSIEPPNEIRDFIRGQEADIVLVTPFVAFGTPQVDYVRAAMALGLPTGLLVKSWDNLSSKGLVREIPDVLTVWNEAQLREATDLHGVPAERVVVTGAQAWDEWFDTKPATSRREFARKVGLSPDRPFLLYLATSAAIGPEAPFVDRWVRRIRASPHLADVGILVRPHPQAGAEQWESLRAQRHDQVVIYPPGGAEPVEPDSKADYFDSMYHANAVIGINTSAMIESAIVGHQVFTVIVPEFGAWQEGTLHFRYLRDAGGGLLNVAASLDEHVQQLSDVVQRGARSEVNPRALKALVRPHGLDEPATPRIVAALETAAARGPSRPYRESSLRMRLARPVLRRLQVGYDAEVEALAAEKTRVAAAKKARARAAREAESAAK